MTTAANTIATPAAPVSFLRKVLMFDALTCLAMGALLVLARQPLAQYLGLPAALLAGAGALLFPCAALMAFTGRAGSGAQPPRALAAIVVAGNAGWFIASVLVAEVLYAPTGLGIAFVWAQALAVAALAAAEWKGMRA